ncbi:MAG: hypothetical protein QNJ85_02820 [Gammaproteobacteria bacterium]|nr:hypothetical protein [Gammaproteobacteria bacterium]
MELVYYTAAGIGLYFLSDWILQRIEIWRGEVFEQRTLVFFGIISVLAVTSFHAIEWLVAR